MKEAKPVRGILKHSPHNKSLRNMVIISMTAISFSCGAQSYAVDIAGESADIVNGGTANGVFTIENTGNPVTSYAGSSQTATGNYSGNTVIKEGAYWAPLDTSSTIRMSNSSGTYGSFTMESNSLIDMTYKYSEANGYTEANGYDVQPLQSGIERKLQIFNGKFGDNLTFHINLGTQTAVLRSDGTWTDAQGYKDTIQFSNAQLLDGVSSSHMHLIYDINKHFGGMDWTKAANIKYVGYIPQIFSIKYDSSLAGKFILSGTQEDMTDGAFNKYKVNIDLQQTQTSSSLTGNVYWTAELTDGLSQGAYSAANAVLSMRNLWRIEDSLFWKRGEDLRFTDSAPLSVGHGEGAWANVWRGKYSFGGIQGSSFGQTYTGIQAGYDKKRSTPLRGGNVYTGIFASRMDSDADFYAQNANGYSYKSGQGNLYSQGVGAYVIWNGNKGNYLDLMGRYSWIHNDYTYMDSWNDVYDNSFTSKTYGLGARYGQRIEHEKWWIEPQIGLSWGKLRHFRFRLGNGLIYDQPAVQTFIGRLSVSAGRYFGEDNRRKELYAKASVNHDFLDGGNSMMYVMQDSSLYSGAVSSVVLDSQKVKALAPRDTWYDIVLGGRAMIGRDTNAWAEITRSFGGKVHTDWQLNGGVSFRWGSGNTGKASHELKHSNQRSISKQVSSLSQSNERIPSGNIVYGNGNKETIPVSDRSEEHSLPKLGQKELPPENETGSQTAINQGETGAYTLTPVVVEAQRPSWENELSPGTVSVIETARYEGEQKTLA